MSSELLEFDSVDDFRKYACYMGSQKILRLKDFAVTNLLKILKVICFATILSCSRELVIFSRKGIISIQMSA